jgi:hypothetical protein
VQDELAELSKVIDDTRIRLTYVDKGKFEFRLFIGSDAIVFQLHTNVFRFEDESEMWGTDYLKENGANGYFAIINMYNFLAESFEHNRSNDAGYLIGRIFLNHDEHFLLEGKGRLAELYTDFGKGVLTKGKMRKIVQSAIAYAIEFDLINPPYEMVQEVSLEQINAISTHLHVATGKRLGFKFAADDTNIF